MNDFDKCEFTLQLNIIKHLAISKPQKLDRCTNQFLLLFVFIVVAVSRPLRLNRIQSVKATRVQVSHQLTEAHIRDVLYFDHCFALLFLLVTLLEACLQHCPKALRKQRHDYLVGVVRLSFNHECNVRKLLLISLLSQQAR
jgi:hypothetical protein